MDGAFDIPDSTDWIETPLKDFSTLENALHCQICKEFYDTPMLTSCSHTFCSKCIRTSLSTDGKCPACRTADQASKLRNNWAVQEVVSAFLAARPAALDVARKANDELKKPGKRKRVVLDSDDVAQHEQDRRTTRSKSRRIAASQTSEPEIIEVEDSDADGDFEPEPVADDGLVDCPLGCGKRMKIEAVDPHLDRCEDEKKQTSRAKSRTPINSFGSSRPSSAQNAKPQERISELSYSLLTETKLKKKLEDLGIPAWGAKSLLIKRHTEWVNIWNANCDSNHPRTKRELLQELDTWERTQGGRAPGMSNLSSNVMRKDFDGAGWARKNQDDFSKLIADAKRKKHNPSLEDDQPKNVDVDTTTQVADIQNISEGGGEASMMNGHHEVETGSGQAIHDFAPNDNSSEPVDSIPSRESMKKGSDFQIRSAATNGVPGNDPFHREAPSAAMTEADHPGLFEQSLSQRNSGSEGVMRKVPMFAVPQEYVTDVDGGSGEAVGHQN